MSLSEQWLWLLVLLPAGTEFLEQGRWPASPREWTTEVLLTLCVGLLVWRLRRRLRQLTVQNQTDGLTGIGNRRRFETDLGREIARGQRMGTTFTLAILDVDDFKGVNDRFGHNRGDKLLCSLGRLLQGGIRYRVDGCYRIGGDEFALLLPSLGTEGAAGAEARIEQLRDQGNRFLARYGAGLSIGAAEPEPDESPEQFFHRVDRRMYGIKVSRKGAVPCEPSCSTAGYLPSPWR